MLVARFFENYQDAENFSASDNSLTLSSCEFRQGCFTIAGYAVYTNSYAGFHNMKALQYAAK